jgi:hypothetical protein
MIAARRVVTRRHRNPLWWTCGEFTRSGEVRVIGKTMAISPNPTEIGDNLNAVPTKEGKHFKNTLIA